MRTPMEICSQDLFRLHVQIEMMKLLLYCQRYSEDSHESYTHKKEQPRNKTSAPTKTIQTFKMTSKAERIRDYTSEFKGYNDQQIFNAAMEFGNVPIIQYIHTHGLKFLFKDSFPRVITSGSLDAVKYCHEVAKAPWNEQATTCSVVKGKIEILEYLLENGCPINMNLCIKIARRKKDPRLLEVLTTWSMPRMNDDVLYKRNDKKDEGDASSSFGHQQIGIAPAA